MAEEPAAGDGSGHDGKAGLAGWWRRLLAGLAPTDRTRGYPTSSNRASSMHLFWDLPGSFIEVSVTLTVLDEPQTDDLYFWALQVGFEDAASGRREGAAHTGPQWAAQHPGHGAVNWGGYGAHGELNGGQGWLRSSTGNANSVDYPWRVGVPYRLAVARAPGDLAPPGFTAWRATITPLGVGVLQPQVLQPQVLQPQVLQPQVLQPQVIRDLWAPGDRLVSPMVWSEVFARCDAAPVRVEWRDPTAIDERGGVHGVGAATVNYQSVADGGCSNTDVSASAGPEGPAWVQTTATERRTRPGARLQLQDRPGGIGA